MNIDAMMIHEQGNLYHRDLIIPEEQYLQDASLINKMFEYEMQIIRSGNFFIYKIEEMEVDCVERIYRNVGQRFRFHCIRLGNPKVILTKRTKEALKNLGVLS